MYFKSDQIKFQKSIVYLILIILLNSNQICRSKKINSQKIDDLLNSSPFTYNQSPWITRNLLLSLNDSLRDVDFYSHTKDQIEKMVLDNLKYDYQCDDSFIQVSNKVFDIRFSSNDINEFKKIESQLYCNEKFYLNQISNDNDKKNWKKCDVLDLEKIDKICLGAKKVSADRFEFKKDRNYGGHVKIGDKNYDEHKKIEDESLKKEKEILKKEDNKLKYILNQYSLKYCPEFNLKDVLGSFNRRRLVGHMDRCKKILSEIIQLDALVNLYSCEFDRMLSAMQCDDHSVKSNCYECSAAYKQWTCSMILPYHKEDQPIKPCLSVCNNVERTCPYLQPEDEYGGESIFVCNEPYKPDKSDDLCHKDKDEVKDESYGENGQCYQKFDLEADHTLKMKSQQMKSNSFDGTFNYRKNDEL